MFILLLFFIMVATSFILSRTTCGFLNSAAFAMAGDEDMKIVPNTFPDTSKRDDAGEAEAEANAYMRQKNNGNIDKARLLGRQFAAALCARARSIADSPAREDDYLSRMHHQLLLFSYIINRVIAEMSPNSILAQTTVNVFYAEMEDTAPEIYGHIRDMASFSLYILCERSETCNEYEIGKVYARLCGGNNQVSVSREGTGLYHEYYRACRKLYEQTNYHTI